MIEQRQFLEYRLNVVRLGQALSVVGFIALTIHLLGDGTLSNPDVRTPIVVLGLALAGAVFAPWRSLLMTFWGDVALLLWAGAMAGALLLADSVAADDILAIAFLAIVVFTAAALANPIITSSVSLISLVCYFLVVQGQDFEVFTANNIIRLGAFATAAALLLIAATGIRKQMRTTAQRLENLVARDVELTEREGELQHLYDVSRTIGTGTDLSLIHISEPTRLQ